MEIYFKRGFLIAIPLLVVLFFVLNPIESAVFPSCIFYSATGFFCPGCGSQRAIHSLLHLNLQGVISNNILFIPAFLAIGYHYIHPRLNTKYHLNLPNIFYLKSTPWVILGIIMLFWILRNFSFSPFSELAPK